MTDRATILIVDDEPNNLKLLQQVMKDSYHLLFATNGEKAIAAANKHQPKLILLDIMMPGMSGYEVCEKLKKDPETEHIPVIFVTAMSEMENEARGFDVGAVDFIQKPISGPIVLRRVQTQLSLVRAETLDRLARSSIYMLGEAGHYNDTDTGVHIWRMAAYSRAIARAAGWQEDAANMLELAAPMHDTGKIGIPDRVLKAPRKLTTEEWHIMRTHAQIGYDILSKSDNPVFRLAATIALAHHERWDGKGYPNGLVGEEIPEAARIVAIADVFDALTMKRPYKNPWPIDQAVATIKEKSGTHFEPQLVACFCNVQDEIIQIKQRWDEQGSGNKPQAHQATS